MDPKRKYQRPPANIVYEIDGASYGLDDRLVEAIKKSIRARLESKTLDIPRLPQAASRILQLSQNPDSTTDEVVQVISTDPLLATRILRVANSASFKVGDHVEGLEAAILRIGERAVQDMVFAESIRLRIFSSPTYRALLEESWKLSLGTAVSCQALSGATGLESDSAFLLGLLHDTGVPVLVHSITEYEKQNQGRRLGNDLVEILLSQLHEEIGGYVLADWDMSASIVCAARDHHRYRGGADSAPAHALVHAANLICRQLGIGTPQKDVDFMVQHVFADLNLTDRERIAALLDKVRQAIGDLMVGLDGAPDSHSTN